MEKKTVLLDLHYLPSIAYFQVLLNSETVYIEREENFVKSTYRNRCEIGGANGKLILSIPLIGGKDHHRKYKDVKISYEHDWLKNHWQSLTSCYRRSPYFEYLEDRFRPFYEKEYDYLFDFNLELLQLLLAILKVEKPIFFTKEYEPNPVDKIDLRKAFAPNKPFRTNAFSFQAPQYIQVFEPRNGFLPNLSLVDYLFCEGPKSVLHHLTNC